MEHLGSSYRSTRTQILNAEDRGFDAGHEVGIADGVRLAADLLERLGFTDASSTLRAARLVNTTNGDFGA